MKEKGIPLWNLWFWFSSIKQRLDKTFMKFLSIFIQIDILHKNVLAHLVSFSFFLKIVFMNSAWKNINTNNQEILFNPKHFYLFLLWEPFKCTICATRYAQNSKTWLEYTNYISSWHKIYSRNAYYFDWFHKLC